MYKLTSFLFCLLVLWVGQSQAKPQLGAIIDKVTGVFDDCDDVYKDKVEDKWQSGQCAIVFDEDDCSDGKFRLCPCASSFVFICTFHLWMTSTDEKVIHHFFHG